MESLNRISGIINSGIDKAVTKTSEKVENLIKFFTTPTKEKASIDIAKSVSFDSAALRGELEIKVKNLKEKATQTGLLNEVRGPGKNFELVEVHEKILNESGMGNVAKLILSGKTSIPLEDRTNLQLQEVIDQTNKALELLALSKTNTEQS